jgi:hypothetical protein
VVRKSLGRRPPVSATLTRDSNLRRPQGGEGCPPKPCAKEAFPSHSTATVGRPISFPSIGLERYTLMASSSRSSNYQSWRLRTARLRVRVPPGVPFRRVSPSLSRRPARGAPSERRRGGGPQFATANVHVGASILWRAWEAKSLTRHQFVGPAPAAHVVQGRDGAFKTRTVSVQIRPWAPARGSKTFT